MVKIKNEKLIKQTLQNIASYTNYANSVFSNEELFQSVIMCLNLEIEKLNRLTKKATEQSQLLK